MPESPISLIDRIILEHVEPNAVQVDEAGRFPRENIDAMAAAGLLGLVSATEVGGMGFGMNEATDVVGRLAEHCTSTAMIVCMHYAATAVIEALGADDVRREIGAGRHLSTLAFSEKGSRSQFWAPLSTARAEGDNIILDAAKSWVTSAPEAASYVWSSKPASAEGASTLWLVPLPLTESRSTRRSPASACAVTSRVR